MRILCVCTGNTCRSPMLAALLRAALAERGLDEVQVTSAGVAVGGAQPASPPAQTVMRERGLDLAEHRSQQVDREAVAAADMLLTMSDRHAQVLIELGAPGERIAVLGAERGGIPDPFGGSDDEYRATAAVLAEIADDLAERIAQHREASR